MNTDQIKATGLVKKTETILNNLLLTFAKIMEIMPKHRERDRHSGLDPESSAFYGFSLDSRFRGNDEP